MNSRRFMPNMGISRAEGVGFDGESAHRAIIHIGAILKEVRQKRIFVRKTTAFVQVVV
jgi:hypothetical protein